MVQVSKSEKSMTMTDSAVEPTNADAAAAPAPSGSRYVDAAR